MHSCMLLLGFGSSQTNRPALNEQVSGSEVASLACTHMKCIDVVNLQDIQNSEVKIKNEIKKQRMILVITYKMVHIYTLFLIMKRYRG